MLRRDFIQSLAAAPAFAAGNPPQLQRLPHRLLVLTFDDAASSHATFVAPLLKQYGFGGTFFVCEFPPDFATDKKRYMSWEQMRTLHQMGFEIGSHTRTHKKVRRFLVRKR